MRKIPSYDKGFGPLARGFVADSFSHDTSRPQQWTKYFNHRWSFELFITETGSPFYFLAPTIVHCKSMLCVLWISDDSYRSSSATDLSKTCIIISNIVTLTSLLTKARYFSYLFKALYEVSCEASQMFCFTIQCNQNKKFKKPRTWRHKRFWMTKRTRVGFIYTFWYSLSSTSSILE